MSRTGSRALDGALVLDTLRVFSSSFLGSP
jgi:hypothetical protein